MVSDFDSFGCACTQWTQGWRGSVKARRFVLALKDHYEEMVAGNSAGAANSDEWALEYININWVRKFMEAFDGDASGFITVKEANDFTGSRPLDWRWVPGNPDLLRLAYVSHSLPHWLAYWAIGDCSCSIGCGGLRLTVTRLADDLYKLLQED